MDILKQIFSLAVAVFVVMVIIYILRRVGGGVPVIGDVVKTVWN